MTSCDITTPFVDALFGAFGISNGPAHLSFVECLGMEDSIFDCLHDSNIDQNLFCYRSEPVGVICITEDKTGMVFYNRVGI